MPFDLIYANDAAEQLLAVPVHLYDYVVSELERLADDPVSASNPPSSPLWPASQLFVFPATDGVIDYAFYVVWRYGDDEKSLLILTIAHTKTPRKRDDG